MPLPAGSSVARRDANGLPGRGASSASGGQLIVVGRFIPGGRTVVTLSAGMLRFRWRRFLVFDAAAALIWALYAALLGYFGGRAFENAERKGLLLALGIGLAVGGLLDISPPGADAVFA
jgi:membrane protein DedA with SNARE-associated domain